MVDLIGQGQAHYTRRGHFDTERMAGSVAAWGNSSMNKSNTQSKDINLIVPSEVNTNTVQPSFSFGELLDIINPLQHIPVVGSFYRNFTGDEMSPVARIVGGTIYGGPLGGLASIAAAAIEEHSGEDDIASALAHSAYGKNSTNRYEIINEQRTAGGQNSSDKQEIQMALTSPAPAKQQWNFNT